MGDSLSKLPEPDLREMASNLVSEWDKFYTDYGRIICDKKMKELFYVYLMNHVNMAEVEKEETPQMKDVTHYVEFVPGFWRFVKKKGIRREDGGVQVTGETFMGGAALGEKL